MTAPHEHVIRDEDRRLEAGAQRAGEELARHRWHWTLDESNPECMSIRAYGRLVDRGEASIRRIVKGYAAWTAQVYPRTRSLADCIEASDLGAEREAAVQAVADAQGTTFAHVAGNKRDEVTSTLGVARERAERRDTTVEEELVNVARHREKARRADAAGRQLQRRMRTTQFIRLEGELGKAARSLRAALELAQTSLVAEERDLLLLTLGNVRALLGLVEMRLAGTADVNWDEELARLEARP